jgi:hypothetical protein
MTRDHLDDRRPGCRARASTPRCTRIQYVPRSPRWARGRRVASIQIGSINTPDAVVIGHIFGNTLTVVAVQSGALAWSATSLFGASGVLVDSTYDHGVRHGHRRGRHLHVNNPQTVGASFTGTGLRHQPHRQRRDRRSSRWARS